MNPQQAMRVKKAFEEVKNQLDSTTTVANTLRRLMIGLVVRYGQQNEAGNFRLGLTKPEVASIDEQRLVLNVVISPNDDNITIEVHDEGAVITAAVNQQGEVVVLPGGAEAINQGPDVFPETIPMDCYCGHFDYDHVGMSGTCKHSSCNCTQFNSRVM